MDLSKTIRKCIKGSSKAKRALYEYYAPKLLGVCRRYVSSQYEAEDIFQEAFINIFKNLHQFDPNKGTFEGWAYRIGVNTALAHLKKEVKFKSDELNAETNTTKISVVVNEAVEYKELQAIIDKLPAQQKVVFTLYAIEGYTHKEIAESLDIEQGTSKSNLSKARINLQKLHKEYYSINDGKVKTY